LKPPPPFFPYEFHLIYLRSFIFNATFYLVTLLFLIAAIPTFLMPPPAIRWVARTWGATCVWLLNVICGTKLEVRGHENIPAGGAIVASKHQSAFETFALLPLFPDFAIILKRELMWLPMFGWYMWKAGMIPIDRGARGQVVAAMTARASAALAEGRQIIIFPEGTRRPPGAEPTYKFGVARLYADTGYPCVPVALNSGVFWPRRKFLRYPGTIVFDILPPIQPGLSGRAFFERLQSEVEAATGRLIAESNRTATR
jgi:1-acyl-sn-glycerol-3-phosphate acyltransferase